MHVIRQILGDRLSGGVFAVLIAYVIVVQGLAFGFSQGAMAGPAGSADLGVICTGGHGASTVPAGGTEDLGGHACCAGLCRLACAGAIAILVPGSEARLANVQVARHGNAPDHGPAHAGSPVTLPGQRAPPSLG